MSITTGRSSLELPSGVVTFLFTDIEGSTRLWERHPQLMRRNLARHDSLLRRAIESHGGYVFKTVGDAFCAAFSSAVDALSAALSAQRALKAEDWGEDTEMRVRIALHTAEVAPSAGDYFGPPLNRVARLLSAGHGGQVLLTSSTHELVRDQLPPGCELRDLGEKRLRDLARAEHVYQLCSPDLLSEFPALRTSDARPNNLPAETTPLIGREREVELVRQRLAVPPVRLLTLTGPGGSGKTRLALRAAAELLPNFAQGAFLVDLTPVQDPTLVALTIARTLGVEITSQQPPVETLKNTLCASHLLLVLDNFEHVLSAATDVAELLGACPHLVVLATSREPLRLRGEHVLSVPPLQLPILDTLPVLKALEEVPAVELFVQRASAVRADFALAEENARAVAEICVRLDGLPLAIELAAARSNVLSPQAMLLRLGRRLQLLTSRSRDLPARHGTLRSAIAWSYDLLTAEEQTTFRRLGVFAGGFDLEAAAGVMDAARLGIDTLETVASLVDKGLVQLLQPSSVVPRFRMLETIREYAIEQLEASGELNETRRRHAHFFLAVAEQGEPKLRGAEQEEWLARLDREHDNFRAALDWAQKAADGPEVSWRLGWALGWFWQLQGHCHEGRQWLEQMLETSSDVPPATRGRLLVRAGTLTYIQGDLARARLLLEEGAITSRAAGDDWVAALGLGVLAYLALNQGRFQEAEAVNAEALRLFESLADRWGIAWAQHLLGRVAYDQGEYARAAIHLEMSLALRRELQDTWGVALALHFLGRVAYGRAEYERARALHQESLELARRVEAKRYIAWALQHLGRVALASGDPATATELVRESLASAVQRGDKPGIVACLESLASVDAEVRQPQRGARLFGAAEALRAALDLPRPPADQAEYEQHVAVARLGLTPAIFADAWKEGRAFSQDRAVEYALRSETRSPRKRGVSTDFDR